MCKQWDCQKLDKPFVVYKKLHFINVVKSELLSQTFHKHCLVDREPIVLRYSLLCAT